MTSKLTLTRRDILRYTAAASASAMMPRMAFAQNNDAWMAVEEAASKEGKVVVYYSGVPLQRAQTFIDAWSAKYPDIKLEYVEVPGGATIGRVLQESMAGGPTCDVTTNTLGVVDGLIKQDMLQAIDWKSYGMEPTQQQNPNPYCFATHATSYCTMYNKNLVKAEDAPKTAEDLTDPKWTGRWGTWNRPLGILTLIGAWGEDKTTEYVHKLAATKPRLFQSGAAWTDACTSGQIDMVNFIPTYTTVAPIRSGAPVDMVMIEPVPLTIVYGIAPKAGANPNAAKVLIAWLAGEGSVAVEKASGRGNPFDPNSETAKQLQGYKTSALDSKFEAEKAEYLGQIENRYAEILQGR
jgi:iron(III) transport system substrate-binding protein